MEWWKLWVPFVATILGILANVWINNTQNKKQQDFQEKIIDKQQELQKEMTKSQIDADIKAKARIQWISDVRGLAARFISNFYEIKKNDTDFEEKFIEIFKDAELLKLYFGAYNDNKPANIDYDFLFNMKDNQNKNIQIFNFIDAMLGDLNEKSITQYQYNLKKYNDYKLEFKRYEDEMRKCCTVEIDEFGMYEEVPTEENEAYHNHLFGELQDLKKESSLYYQNLRQYDQRITDFEKIISIYLKIEWEIAKDGK